MRERISAALICVALLAGPASGVLINAGDGSKNSRAPADDPGWSNIGVVNGLTATYLGDGWIISAAHVGERGVSIGGVRYPPVPGSQVVLRHSEEKNADLQLFRVAPYPGDLSSLPIHESAPPLGAAVVMVGTGYERGDPISIFDPTHVPDGFAWGPGKRMRWGTNSISAAAGDFSLGGMTTRAFIMNFTRHGPDDEAQATIGDSGGPVFIKHQGVWELAGVMFAVAVVQNQPARTAAYDNLTYAADLSHYRSQILEIITPNCGNGHLTVDEECDPGSETANGCCTSTCEFAARGAVCDDGDPCSDGDQCDPTGLCLPGARDLCDRGAPDSPPKP